MYTTKFSVINVIKCNLLPFIHFKVCEHKKIKWLVAVTRLPGLGVGGMETPLTELSERNPKILGAQSQGKRKQTIKFSTIDVRRAPCYTD